MKKLVNFEEMLINATANELMELPFVKMVEHMTNGTVSTIEIEKAENYVSVKKEVVRKNEDPIVTSNEYPIDSKEDKEEFIDIYEIDSDGLFSIKDDTFKSGKCVNVNFGDEKFSFIHTGDVNEGSAEQFNYDKYGNIIRKRNLFSQMEEVYDYDFKYGFEDGLPASVIQRSFENKALITMITLYSYLLDEENGKLKQYESTIFYRYDDDGMWVDTSSSLTRRIYRKVKGSNFYLLSSVSNDDEIESEYEYFNEDGNKRL